MIEAFLFVLEENILPVLDAIDIYEGSIPPSATFQVVDVDNSTVIESEGN